MVGKKLFLVLLVLAVLFSGCIEGTQKNNLKDKIISSRQISFADYVDGLGNEKFSGTNSEGQSSLPRHLKLFAVLSEFCWNAS